MALATRDALIQAAEGLMRTKGYAAFSYADLADAVGIRKASIHYHFPTKEDLGIAIVEEYVSQVQAEFERIEINQKGAEERLKAFYVLFYSSTEGGLLPLCGALAAEMAALPDGLQRLTRRFFDVQLSWLTRVMDEGIAAGELPQGRGSREKSYLLLSILEGSSFINWATKDGEMVNMAVLRMIAEY
ncbi:MULTISPECIES: TetR/AcrR family transcriptional regulator [Pseudomonas]|jgi:TetR/AcrR family transcriptional repressor of nem operon|uniref:TetR/AcrR family transcriptional regulator n=1 Tax=Pseudomonas urmiensis TaxID=2745493 RepID=A0A923FUC3_9PSED|nr:MULTISPECIES: TetR/AcrR family transcriptional regulator [Pseudomonas]MBT9235715.1 TetR/AcrR family transcriptional regulator [Pseudomonas sp. MG-2]MBV4538615.1 TetR/AcrR family transcriptional regulator [Pseudomonas urmiensis]MCM8915309.1 TetR/AcrR family transcriptional regulator [Pseudomonas inefficax]MPT20811.1 TetR/AcrR family transcriptional regulator [Pseudomonas sp.]OAS08905.1 TetR family transcriptional regulator [Pseudomonas putida]